MFGIANQLLAVIALALVTTLLINTGRGKFAAVTVLPMAFVSATTMTAAAEMVGVQFPAMIGRGLVVTGILNIALTLFVVVCVGALLLIAVSRWVLVLRGLVPVRPESEPPVAEFESFTAPAKDGETRIQEPS
jgi:carbon starvation protein